VVVQRKDSGEVDMYVNERETDVRRMVPQLRMRGVEEWVA